MEFKLPKQPPKYMFWVARILGHKVNEYVVQWRGKYWVHKPMPITDTDKEA